MKAPRKVTYRAWCGRYTGTVRDLGWLMPPYLEAATPLSEDQRQSLAGAGKCAAADFYRVKVTLEPVRNKRGKLIVRRTKLRKYRDDD